MAVCGVYVCRYEKEKRDYAFCLRQAAHSVKFVLAVEDDALPMNESLSVLSRLVTGHWTSRSDGHIGQWFYVKLYHPIHLQGYGACLLFFWTVMSVCFCNILLCHYRNSHSTFSSFMVTVVQNILLDASQVWHKGCIAAYIRAL